MTGDEPTRMDRTALVAGVLFTVLGVVFWIDAGTDIEVEMRFIWPILLIGLGLAGLVSSARRS